MFNRPALFKKQDLLYTVELTFSVIPYFSFRISHLYCNRCFDRRMVLVVFEREIFVPEIKNIFHGWI